MEACRLLVVVLVALMCQTPETNACSCLPTHIQDAFCSADYVIWARILPNEVPSEDVAFVPGAPSTRVFPIDVKKVFKGNKTELNQAGQMHTATSSATCGVYLKARTSYLIMGHIKRDGNMSTSLCDTTMEWRRVDASVRRAININIYGRNCQCQVETCFPGCDESPASNTCQYEPFSDNARCYDKYGRCQKTKGVDDNETTTQCAWKRSPKIRKCLRDVQKAGRKEP